MKGESFLTKNISGFTQVLESAILIEDISRTPGLLQKLDPRAKIITFVLFILTVGLARNLTILSIIFVLALIFCLLSRVSLWFFLKRVFLFIPVFTLVIAIPALFITPGNPLLQVSDKVIITIQGAYTAGLLFLRVTDSLSFGVLLILTTPWTKIMAALRWWRLPFIFVDILGMTYRYIFLLLHTVNSMFLARRSRVIGGFTSKENRRWLVKTLTTTVGKSQHLSEEVYLAMLSRGYQGEVRVLNDFRLKRQDVFWLSLTLIAVSILLWSSFL